MVMTKRVSTAPAATGEPEREPAVTSEQVAGQLFGTWVWPFELLSLLLLAALVGALAVARRPVADEGATG